LLKAVRVGTNRPKTLVGKESKAPNIQSSKNIKAKIKGNSTVQQKDISW